MDDGNLLFVWAKDIWKDIGDGTWSSSSIIDSDYDLFYRILDPFDLFESEEIVSLIQSVPSIFTK